MTRRKTKQNKKTKKPHGFYFLLLLKKKKKKEQEVGSYSLTSINFSFQRNIEVNRAGWINDWAAICFCSPQLFGNTATSVKYLPNTGVKRAVRNLRGAKQQSKALIFTRLQELRTSTTFLIPNQRISSHNITTMCILDLHLPVWWSYTCCYAELFKQNIYFSRNVPILPQ